MPDQLTDLARKAAEEIQDYCDLSSHDCDRVAAIIDRHMHGWLEDIRKMEIEEKKENETDVHIGDLWAYLPEPPEGMK